MNVCKIVPTVYCTWSQEIGPFAFIRFTMYWHPAIQRCPAIIIDYNSGSTRLCAHVSAIEIKLVDAVDFKSFYRDGFFFFRDLNIILIG